MKNKGRDGKESRNESKGVELKKKGYELEMYVRSRFGNLEKRLSIN